MRSNASVRCVAPRRELQSSSYRSWRYWGRGEGVGDGACVGGDAGAAWANVEETNSIRIGVNSTHRRKAVSGSKIRDPGTFVILDCAFHRSAGCEPCYRDEVRTVCQL